MRRTHQLVSAVLVLCLLWPAVAWAEEQDLYVPSEPGDPSKQAEKFVNRLQDQNRASSGSRPSRVTAKQLKRGVVLERQGSSGESTRGTRLRSRDSGATAPSRRAAVAAAGAPKSSGGSIAPWVIAAVVLSAGAAITARRAQRRKVTWPGP